MSRSKLFNMIKSRGEQPLGRNPFDLLNRHVYTQKVAKIMPVKAFHTMPDDYLEVEMSEFSQNKIPMNTAAFVSGKKELLAYFVPYNSVWHNFNQYQATREDPDSAALQAKGISYEPRISLNFLYRSAMYFAIGAFMYESWNKLYAPNMWYNDFRNNSDSSAWTDFNNEYGNNATIPDLVEFMQRNSYADSTMNDWEFYCRKASSSIASRSFAVMYSQHKFAFEVSWDCFEHARLHDDTLTFGQTFLNMFGTPIWCDWMMKLDMLRYGNIYPIIHNWRVSMDKFVADTLADTSYEVTPSAVDSAYKDLINDIFGSYDPDVYSDATSIALQKLDAATLVNSAGDNTSDEYVNVYALYAYNKCFYSYMRNVYFDTNYHVRNYNCDFVDCTDWESSIIGSWDIPYRFYHLESHQWKKDMFTAVLPSNQLGAVSSVVIDLDSISAQTTLTGNPAGSLEDASVGSPTYPAWGDPDYQAKLTYNDGLVDGADIKVGSTGYLSVANYASSTSQVKQKHSHSLDGTLSLNKGDMAATTSVTGSQVSFDVLSLKRAEALQQYAQDLMRAGNRTQDIFNQIYGVTPKSEMDETPYFIDVASSDINVNPIISTAATGQDENGKLGDVAARVTIGGQALNFKFSTKDFGVVLFLSYIVPDSFYNSYSLDPCVTHLDPESHGLPYFQNLGLQPVLGEFLNNLRPISIRSRVCGFTPPYIERKTDIDLVHGNLVDTFLPKVSENDVESEYNGEMAHWVVARTDMQQEDTVSLRNFYIDPRIMDNVFTFSADSDLSTDHFLTYCSIKINAVRALSEIGLPRF